MNDSVRKTAPKLLEQAPAAVRAEGPVPEIPGQSLLEGPKRPKQGGYSTNVAVAVAKPAGKPPRFLGEVIAERLRVIAADIESVDEFAIAGCLAMSLNVDFDVWQSDRELHDQGQVMATLDVRPGSSTDVTMQSGCERPAYPRPHEMKHSQAAEQTRGMDDA